MQRKLRWKKRMGFTLSLSIFLLFVFPFSCKKADQTEDLIAKSSSQEHAGHIPSESRPQEKKEAKKQTRYQCPMHPSYTSDKPGDCPICGMSLVPIEEEEAGMKMEQEMPRGTVRINPEKQQLLGVTFGAVKKRNLEKQIRTVAKFTYDETRLKDINTKFPGWVEKLFVNFTGQLVKKGQPLFSIYSPELVSAQEEYLLALKAKGYFKESPQAGEFGRTDTLVDVARRRLILWNITEKQIQELENTQKPFETLIFYAPFTGFVIEKNVLQGKYIMAGESLYKLADISTIWVLADIYEYELPFVSKGKEVQVELPYFPGEVSAGRITYIYPYLENETRTAKVRIVLSNRDFKFKPDMYGTVRINFPLGERLTLHENAVLDSGTRKLVFVDKGEGYFEPREVRLGMKIEDYYEVLGGVEEGERVVTSANFLIDSESRLKSAVKETHKH